MKAETTGPPFLYHTSSKKYRFYKKIKMNGDRLKDLRSLPYQHCTIQSNLQTQCYSYQNSMIFAKNRKTHPKIHDSQKP
jgi:hypothetical protein